LSREREFLKGADRERERERELKNMSYGENFPGLTTPSLPSTFQTGYVRIKLYFFHNILLKFQFS
jgi:hypothetical protein